MILGGHLLSWNLKQKVFDVLLGSVGRGWRASATQLMKEMSKKGFPDFNKSNSENYSSLHLGVRVCTICCYASAGNHPPSQYES